MSSHSVEREDKYEVEQTFRLPDLTTLVPPGGRLEKATRRLTSVYFDTAERDLLGRAITLRRRDDDSGAESGWQLKLPAGNARTELSSPATESRVAVPHELAELLTGIRRGRVLRQFATLRTERRATRIWSGEGELMVEIADDHVFSAATGGAGARLDQWREVEAELGPAGNEKLLLTVGKLLRRAGAIPSRSASKVARATGRDLPAAANDGVRDASRKTKSRGEPPLTAAEVMRRYFAQQDDVLVMGDLALRRGEPAIHSTRVATRRLRSTLRIFRALLEEPRAAAFDAEVRWYASVLGKVRDLEVQRTRLLAAVAELPPGWVVGPVVLRIEDYMKEALETALTELRQAMATPTYIALLEESELWAVEPAISRRGESGTKILLRKVKAAERKTDKHLEAGLAGKAGAQEEEMHEARKSAKRARYATELLEPVIGGKQVKRRAHKHTRLQELLGEHQDSVVAAALLCDLGAAASAHGEDGYTFGLLFAREKAIAQATLEATRRL
ncbi:CYTH and CHAD domain-containing protein [Nakamurella antarctica]|uniref:CYTH and CHAD domain-containing protein n=1 Tax=Nakamurella antarctica TaxID=1902245 RepID=UPI0013DE2F99|nr:CYTH and CHAD domain-containing protein [Nakamurella antarctica]